MNKSRSRLAVGMLSLFASLALMAQNEQPANQTPPPAKFEGAALSKDQQSKDQQSGLDVEERRFKNRLDGVTIQHGEKGPTDYYNLSDPDIERRNGGITERSAMRTWRLGGH